MNSKIKCDKCGYEFSKYGYKNHYRSCKGKLERSRDIKSNKIDYKEFYNEDIDMYICPFCEKKLTKYGVHNHIPSCVKNPNPIKNNRKKGHRAWNKGLTKNTDNRVKRGADTYKQRLKSGDIKIWSKGLTKENDERLKVLAEHTSEGMKKAHSEGRAHNIGQSRWNNEKSYPEKFFMEVIENEFEDKNYKMEYPLGIFSGDFVWEHKRKVIEIDGEQHERAEQKDRDRRKNKYMEDNNWTYLRIKWIEMFNNTKHWIKIAKDFIDY